MGWLRVLLLRFIGEGAKDPWGNEKIGFEASGEIDRRDFGLTWNKGLKKVGGFFVGNMVKFDLQIQANKKINLK